MNRIEMRYFLLIYLFIVIAQLSFGQSVGSISKIQIEYGKGNAWSDTLQIGKAEIIEISPFNSDFMITRYIVINYYGKPTWRKDTIAIDAEKTYLIKKNKVNYLFEQLNSNKNNFTSDFVKPRIRCPTKRQILNVAKSDTAAYWKFSDKEYLENSVRKRAIRKIKGFDKLDTFLYSHQPDPDAIAPINDVWDSFRIFCISNKDTLVFQTYTFKLLCQPFEKFKRHDNSIPQHGFVNLEMNTSLQDILPKRSLLRKRLDLNALTEKYIEWYLKEKL